jgi:ribonuclease HI
MDRIKKSFLEANRQNKYRVSDNTSIWFTDGSCTGNGTFNSVGGYASVCVGGPYIGTIIMAKIDNKIAKATNIRAEGLAIIKTLDHISNNTDTNTIIYSDSKFWINMIYDYMPNWSDSKFDTKANPDLTREINSKWKSLKSAGKSVTITHVYAHNKSSGKDSLDPFKHFCYTYNDIVDNLAEYARSLDGYEIITQNIID